MKDSFCPFLWQRIALSILIKSVEFEFKVFFDMVTVNFFRIKSNTLFCLLSIPLKSISRTIFQFIQSVDPASGTVLAENGW